MVTMVTNVAIAIALFVTGGQDWVPLEPIAPFDDRGTMFRVLDLSDLDGDGYNELATSQLGDSGKPAVVDVHGGLDRNRWFRLKADPSYANRGSFGAALARGRVLGLGRDALLVGDFNGGSTKNNGSGQVVVFDPLLGTELGALHGQVADAFGIHVESGTDLDGDGNDEVLVGAQNAPISSGARNGVVYLFDGLTLTERFRWEGTTSGEGFDGPFAFLDDLDGDGTAEILLASEWWDSPSAFNAGMVMIASGATGQVIWSGTGTNPLDLYGAEAVRLKDLDGDGRAEFGWLTDGASRLVVYGSIPGAPLLDIRVANHVINPWVVAAISDRTGDGVPEIAVAGRNPPVGWGRGRIALYSGATGALVEVILPPRSSTFDNAFAVSIIELEDVTGDGQVDLAAVGTGTFNDGEVILWQAQSIHADPRGLPKVHLRAPGHAFGQYALYFSDSIVDGSPLGTRTIPLDSSPLYVWSSMHPVIGWLDGNGQARVDYELPPEGIVKDGDRIFAAWLGLDSASPNGVKVISNPIVVPMQ